ncbi:FAD-binding domain-containing protein [Aspergillus campestris IBT 28561]|uniref:FAD-binding domain-containing protein n=1 Tax=Aspergillus campestris (strain IBT 28561) TaxID=1392248 RepID=A0A2I1D2H8_ASPC2|nr:FAD-binding domain-containing protein [Aspergillus campestris IBT 28561]PKY04093.1 FAD-binding domain-containing protein [Aspergillus campestris IBT 28561]
MLWRPLTQLLALLSLASVVLSSSSICDRLRSQIPGRVVLPREPLYAELESSYYSQYERALKPSCIFRPTRTAEVSEFIHFVNENANASSSPLKFAVRGGGHTLFSGAANIKDGITVDMRSMKSLVLSADRKTASVGGGSIFSDLYGQLDRHNLTVMGGRVPGIGVGGFTTGGGLNFLSRDHGYSCDNVYGYEVVLGNGSVVHATASANRDLWLALKGGSNNFGIVTRFDLATFPQKAMWGGVLLFKYSQAMVDAQAKAFSEYMNPANFDGAADMAVIMNFADGGFSTGDSLFYTKPVVNPPVYRGFTSFPSPVKNTLALNNVSGMVRKFGETLPPKLNLTTEYVYSFKNPSPATYKELFQIWEQGCRALAHIKGLQVQYLVQPQPVTNGTNSLGQPAGEKDKVMGLVTVAFDNPADEVAALQGARNIVLLQGAVLRREGLYSPFQYLNYAEKSQDPIGSYGKEMLNRLRAVSRKYDPAELFQKSVPGGFKLFGKRG